MEVFRFTSSKKGVLHIPNDESKRTYCGIIYSRTLGTEPTEFTEPTCTNCIGAWMKK